MKPVLYLCAITTALAPAALAQITITEIPVLPGYTQSTAFAVSADGQTIGGISAPGTNMDLVSNPVPMIWTAAGGSQLLPGSAQQPNPSGYCYAISSSGGQIATATSASFGLTRAVTYSIEPSMITALISGMRLSMTTFWIDVASY